MKRVQRVLSLMLCLIMLFAMSLTAGATGVSQADALRNLETQVRKGKSEVADGSDMTTHTYKTSEGGYLYYTEITNPTDTNTSWLSEAKYEALTIGEKQRFLKDMIIIANELVTAEKGTAGLGKGVTDSAVDEMLIALQSKTGSGSALLATLLSETKPRYATANRIFAPFSGVIGTIMALVAIGIMSFLGLTMALDLAYINIPAFQLLCGGESEAGNPNGGGKRKGVGAFISMEAIKSVEAATGGGGGAGGGSGEYKAATGTYFKYRWKGLTILGICLVYLIQGQIFSAIAWFIDLFSGFIGF